jgi:hypothetical protein
LVNDLNDAMSAEAYCSLGGEVVPAKIANTIGETYHLRAWTASPLSVTTTGALQRQNTADESVKKSLVSILLEVYMGGGRVL